MALETKPRHPRDTRPFGTADHRVDNATGDTELVSILDWLADEQWIVRDILAGTMLGRADSFGTENCPYKIVSWRSHSLRYEPDPAIVKEENRERRENRSRHQEAAAMLPLGENNNDK